MRPALAELPAVILAGGLGTRIQHLLPDLPKPMAPVAGRPFLEWVVRYLARQGVRSVLISTGYRADAVAAHFDRRPVPGVTVRCIAEPAPLGTAGGFLLAARQSGLRPPGWLLLNGDTLAFADLAALADALTDPAVDGAICARPVPDASRYGSLVTDAQGRLVRFEEKRPGAGLISMGIYLFRDALVGRFDPRTPSSLEREVFPALTAAGAFLRVLPMPVPFLDIGTPETLGAAAAFVGAHEGQFVLS